jgi:hypothetical protein
MMTTTRRYFVAINHYRSSTGAGFANTWRVHECKGKAQQSAILRDGLPVYDQWFADGSPVYSTKGVRAATATEIRQATRNEEAYGPIPSIGEQP